MFNTNSGNGVGVGVGGGQQSTNVFRSHIRSISPIGSNSFVDETNRYNLNNDMWSSRQPTTTTTTDSSSDGEMMVQSPISDTTNRCSVNASAMWDTFLQQQQALLHPWYAEGRENFYITTTTSPTQTQTNGHNNYSFTNNINNNNHDDQNKNLLSSSDFFLETSTPVTNSTTATPLLNNRSNINSVADAHLVNDDQIGDGRPYESICRQMIKLAHELNGWKDDGCPFCCNNKLY